MKKMFKLAKKTAIHGKDCRRYHIGAVGIRTDGTIVKSKNIPCRLPEPQAHAEARVCKKLNKGSVIYVVRIYANGDYAMARPCRTCRKIMKSNGIKRCYYSVGNNEYGVINF